MSCQRQESLECELVSRAVPIHYQCTEVGATLTQTRREDMQTDVVSPSEDCKVETTLSPMEQGRQRPSVSRPSDRDCFVPINLRQIKREIFIDHEIQNVGSSTSPTELNNSIEREHNVREEDIKDEPTSYKELESDDVFDIKIESSDVDDNNETTDRGTVLYEEKERVASLNEDIQTEEMKTETLEEADDEQSAGAATAEKCRETLAEEIQDGSTLTPGGENVKEPRTLCTVVEETTSRDTDRDMSRSARIHLIFVCDQNLLIKHIEYETGSKKLLESEICKVRIDRRPKGSLKKHLKIHSGEKHYECEICKVRFSEKSNLNRHLRIHSGVKDYECEICKVRFRAKSHLKTHLYIHTGEKPYECEICKVRFSVKSTLNKHLRIHSGEKPYECEICKVRFSEKSTLNKHLRIHSGAKPYECEICKVRFSEKSTLNIHLRIHSGEKPYECEICKVRFRVKSHLKIHLYIHTGEKPYECGICKVRFRVKSHLKTHLYIHTGEKPYECEICKVRFRQKGILNTHLRIHSGVKDYECEICKVKFSVKGNLNRHLSIHYSSEKAFECEICKDRFTRKHMLNKHLTTHS